MPIPGAIADAGAHAVSWLIARLLTGPRSMKGATCMGCFWQHELRASQGERDGGKDHYRQTPCSFEFWVYITLGSIAVHA